MKIVLGVIRRLVEQELLILPVHPSVSGIFNGVRVLCVCFVDRCLSFYPFCFGHCVVCPSIYGFWLPLSYLQTLRIANSEIVQLFQSETKFIYNEMMMRFALYSTNTLRLIASSLKHHSMSRHVAPLEHDSASEPISIYPYSLMRTMRKSNKCQF